MIRAGSTQRPRTTSQYAQALLLYSLTNAVHPQIGRYLIEKGADVRSPFPSKPTTLTLTPTPTTQINTKDRASQTPLHRAATTGSVSLLHLLLTPPPGRPKTRLNTADRAGMTPLHLAMESGHGEAAVVLIEAGADRERVSPRCGKVRVAC